MEPKVALQIHHHYFCEGMIELAAACGFRYAALNLGESRCFFEDGWRGEIRRLDGLLKRNGLRCVLIHSPCYDLTLSAEKTDNDMERAIFRSVEGAAMLGAGITAVHPRVYFEDGTEDVEKSYAYNVRYFAPLVREAERLGCRIGIENMPTFPGWDKTFYTNRPSEHRRIVDCFDSPAACAVWDFGHANLANGDPVSALKTLGSRIKATHVHDNGGKNDDHLTPLLGTIDWESEMKALKETGFDGTLTMELHYDDIYRDADRIRDFTLAAYANICRLHEMLEG